MNVGQYIRIIEIIVVIYCGVVLAVRPEKMRWEHKKIPKVIFGVLVLLMMGMQIGNTFFTKYSSVEYLMVSIYLFIVLLIFYEIDFWQLAAQNFIYWINICMAHCFSIYLVCYMNKLTFYDYITFDSISWHWMHLISIIAILFTALRLTYFRKCKALIEFQNKRTYLCFTIMIIIEDFIFTNLFGNKGFSSVQRDYIVFVSLCLLLMLSSGIIIGICKSNIAVKNHGNLLQANFDMLKNHYEILEVQYTEKRKLIHDFKQHNILLHQYLEKGHLDEALTYLDVLETSNNKTINIYTGIISIDCLLSYNMELAKQSNIRVDLKLNVLFCPIADDEMCVILGNLLDNAIEATLLLDSEQRCIEIAMRTVNDIFILEIRNAYRGKRKFIHGKYRTTKENKEMHGLGLQSISQIVDANSGSLSIVDDGALFKVCVTLYKK